MYTSMEAALSGRVGRANDLVFSVAVYVKIKSAAILCWLEKQITHSRELPAFLRNAPTLQSLINDFQTNGWTNCKQQPRHKESIRQKEWPRSEMDT